MVGMTALKRLLILGLSLFVAGNLYAVVRLSEPPKARIEGLESNDEYMSLLYDARHLEEQEDSIKQVIAQNRKAFADEPENRQQYGDVILNLEEELFDLRNRMGEVNDRINTIEQEWLIANMDAMYASRDSVSAADSVDTVAVAADSLAQDSLAVVEATSSRLVSADAFRQVLSDADYDALQRAQDNELKVVEYINMLSENNMAMQTLDRQYAATQDAEEGARLYDNYKVIDGLCRSLNDSIAQVWSTIFDAKSYAYSLLLETRGDEEQLDRNEEEYSAAMQQYAEDRGKYASDALCLYFNTKRTLVDNEIILARLLGYGSAQDSLQVVAQQLAGIDYRLPKVEIQERYFLDYAPIEVSSSYYNSSNPIPECTVYARGTIYRILVGTFSVKQNVSIFRGVHPLCYQKTDEGKYRYFAGGFATEAEADAAQVELKNMGFRRPEVVVWRDSVYVNLAEERAAMEDAELSYRVEISGADSLQTFVRDSIAVAAPGKDITRIEGQFIIATFPTREEAERVVSSISGADSTLTTRIVEIVSEPEPEPEAVE